MSTFKSIKMSFCGPLAPMVYMDFFVQFIHLIIIVVIT